MNERMDLQARPVQEKGLAYVNEGDEMARQQPEAYLGNAPKLVDYLRCKAAYREAERKTEEHDVRPAMIDVKLADLAERRAQLHRERVISEDSDAAVLDSVVDNLLMLRHLYDANYSDARTYQKQDQPEHVRGAYATAKDLLWATYVVERDSFVSKLPRLQDDIGGMLSRCFREVMVERG
ncbi:TPA: hypothetical protein HA265_03625 [Candidatus Woesearchaeota archaeon]|nr:hypothetical protein [Candidatus Woesearchaeota archaeon]